MMMIYSGVSDAFCASAKSFNSRNSKILYDETLFEKGKMFSLTDGDFEVEILKIFPICQHNSNINIPDSQVWILQFPNYLQHSAMWSTKSLWTDGSPCQVTDRFS